MNQTIDTQRNVSFWQPVLFSAIAGGMMWGIRGQYGHETGAMMAGLLVSFVLVFLLCPNFTLTNAVRAVAWATVAMGFGGSMTYGQTVGLMHDAPLNGNWDALRWGMLGLAVKGGIWIGFGGAFLGMGLGGVRYRFRELLLLMFAMIGMYLLGIYLLNSPFDPANKQLPAIYFSDDWYWEPDSELKPRWECWGGLLFALATLIAYTGLLRKDRLAMRMAFWGILGGALGFPSGECLQAYHSWNLDWFRNESAFWANLDPHMNWWNMMEITFGTIMGAALGLGLWLNRHLIQPTEPDDDYLPSGVEWGLLAVHVVLLVCVEFFSFRVVDFFYDLGLIMGIIPVALIAGGRWTPYLMVFPVTLIPIAGKTVRNLVFESQAINPLLGWVVYLIIPLLIAIAVAAWLKRQPDTAHSGRFFARWGLLLCAWVYFLLNYAFFFFPFPWLEWTGRTPSGIIYIICLTALTLLALVARPAYEELYDEEA